LEPHLPWRRKPTQKTGTKQDDPTQKVPAELQTNDWCLSLQLEGASAVWAGVDMLLQMSMLEEQADEDENDDSTTTTTTTSTAKGPQTNRKRTKVAVAGTSYHGPPSTSFGAKAPLWTKPHQLTYPAPRVQDMENFETEDDKVAYEEELYEQFSTFLEQHAHQVGVILFEPQWGSSQAAMPWPKDLLQRYISLSKKHGIKVLCDEIMCGLGRHGHETLFVSQAWELDPDCVTFGKAIGAGVYPISGAITKHGRMLFGQHGASVMQSHTYSGSSARALMAATQVLKELPMWFPSTCKLGLEMEYIFRYLTKISNGLVQCHGQGLMWGGVFTRSGQCSDEDFRNSVIASFKKNCTEVGVLPYHVPVGGFMVSPPIDIDVGMIYNIGVKLEEAINMTVAEVGWEHIAPIASCLDLTAYDNSDDVASVASVASVATTASTTTTGTTSDESCIAVDPTQKLGFSEKEDRAITALAERFEKCSDFLHKTRSCTTCSSFVCGSVRTKFLAV